MSLETRKVLQPPRNWQDFEDLSCDLWRHIWGDENTQKHGRSGQRQNGVDVFGKPKNGTSYAGVQCKGKSRGYGSKLTNKELKEEVTKAKKFTPAITQFILATTAPNDVVVQELARDICENHRQQELFSVHVWGWDDIELRIWDYPQLIDKYYPELSDLTQRLLTMHHDLQQDVSAVHETVKSLSGSQSGIHPVDWLGGDIDEIRVLIRQHKPATALQLLESKKERHFAQSSNLIKFRLLTNMANCHRLLDDAKTAALFYEQAAAYQPDHEQAQANLALSFLIRGDIQQAKYLAGLATNQHPECARAWGIYINTYAADKSALITDMKVPKAMENTLDAAFAMAFYFESRGDIDQAITWIDKALICDPSSLDVRASAGCYYLERVVRNQRYVYFRQLTPQVSTDIAKAHSLLSSAWADLQRSEVLGMFLHVVFNLLTITRLQRHTAEFESLLAQALHHSPSNQDFLYRKALFYLDNNRERDAIDIANSLDRTLHPDVDLIIAEGKMAISQPQEAVQAIDRFMTDNPDHGLAADACLLKLRILIRNNQFNEARDLGERYLVRFPTHITLRTRLAEIVYRLGDVVSAQGMLKEIIDTVDDSADIRTHQVVADSCYACELYRDALNHYQKWVVTDTDSAGLQAMLNCLRILDYRAQLQNILDGMDRRVKDLPFYLRIAADFYRIIGNLGAALERIETYLDRYPDDVEMRLIWIETLVRKNRPDRVTRFIQTYTVPAEASLHEYIYMARVLFDYGRQKDSLALMYNTRRRHMDNPVAHLAYIGFVLNAENERYIDIPTEVAPDCWVEYRDNNGQTNAIIIEADPLIVNPRLEFHPDHPLALAFIGKKKNESSTITVNVFQKDEITITNIMSKYVFAYQDTMLHFGEQFPGNQGLIRFNIGDDIPKTLDTMKGALKNRSDLFKAALDVCREQRMPLCFLANLLHFNLIDTFTSFISHPDSVFITNLGIRAEQNVAANLLVHQDKPFFLIDPITLYTLLTLKVESAVTQVTGRLGVTQSCKNVFLQLIQERRHLSHDGHMSLTIERDHLVRHEVTAAAIEVNILLFESVVQFIDEQCVMVDAIGKADYANEVLKTHFGPAYYDLVLASQLPNRMLLCDDMFFRNICKNEGGCDGLWLQPVLRLAKEHSKLSSVKYHEAISVFHGSHYTFVSIDGDFLNYLAGCDGWDPSIEFKRVVNSFSDVNMDLESVLHVARWFTLSLWWQNIYLAKKQQYLFLLLDVLIRHPHANVTLVIRSFILLSSDLRGRISMFDRAYSKELLNAIEMWIIGHFMAPEIMRALEETPDNSI